MGGKNLFKYFVMMNTMISWVWNIKCYYLGHTDDMLVTTIIIQTELFNMCDIFKHFLKCLDKDVGFRYKTKPSV